jgi:hypothetical protein
MGKLFRKSEFGDDPNAVFLRSIEEGKGVRQELNFLKN